MKARKKIFAGLVMCMMIVVLLAVYLHYFQPEIQTLIKHNINARLKINVEDNKHASYNIRYAVLSPMSNVATLAGLKINAKLQEFNFTHYKKNNENENIVNHLIQDVKKQVTLKRSPWKVASSWVKIREIHPERSENFGWILKAMAEGKIISADIGYKGTQLKMTLLIEGGQKVIFKPKRFSRDHIIYGHPYAGADRHNGEIAAFHLSRLLGFHRTPLVVGRKINLKLEIEPVATLALLKTFTTQNNNTCFYGYCYYCNPSDPACGDGNMMEGAIILWLPERYTLKKYRHPWQRTYNENLSARWETDHGYCERVQQHPLYKRNIQLLDLIDASVFDYLIGNADRHHYEAFSETPNTMVLLLDNGKSFGNPYWDELTILAPLYQCCRIRNSTYLRLQIFFNHLAESMKVLLQQDPLAPVLTDHHLEALDRRLRTIMAAIEVCCDEKGHLNVIQNNL